MKKVSVVFLVTIFVCLSIIFVACKNNTPNVCEIEYYQQNIENDEYTLIDELEFSGTKDQLTNEQIKLYEGFSAPKLEELVIEETKEKFIVKAYYKRNSYTISIENSMEGAGVVNGVGTYRFGQSVNLSQVL